MYPEDERFASEDGSASYETSDAERDCDRDRIGGLLARAFRVVDELEHSGVGAGYVNLPDPDSGSGNDDDQRPTRRPSITRPSRRSRRPPRRRRRRPPSPWPRPRLRRRPRPRPRRSRLRSRRWRPRRRPTVVRRRTPAPRATASASRATSRSHTVPAGRSGPGASRILSACRRLCWSQGRPDRGRARWPPRWPRSSGSPCSPRMRSRRR